MFTTRRAAAVLAVLLLSSGCFSFGGETGGLPSPSPSITASPSDSASPDPSDGATPDPDDNSSPDPGVSCTPAFTANTLADSGTASGGILGLQAATSAGHAGYDRVVFTFGGSAQPGWQVEYVPTAISDGSGDPVAVNGPKVLQVVMKDIGIEGDTGVPDPAVKRFSPSGTIVVPEVVLDTVSEGQYTAFIGVTSTLPFRVFHLANPARVVVDVRHC